jgi:hypothetical protein
MTFMRTIILLLLLVLAVVVWFRYLHREPNYAAEWVQRMSGTNSLALTQLLTGEEPYALTFSVPLKMEINTFDDNHASTNNCWLHLFDNDKPTGDIFYCLTNHTYAVEYGTPFAPHGSTHVLKAVLVRGYIEISGPPLTVSYTNLFKFDDANLFSGSRMWLHCHLGINQAGYRIDLFDTNKVLLNTITGVTTNGAIDEIWDMKTANGLTRTDDQFNADFYIWHVRNGTNQDMGGNIFIPTNPYHYFLLRDKANWGHH